MLAMRHISKVFRTDLIETHALRTALEVAEGEFVAVTGPSGSEDDVPQCRGAPRRIRHRHLPSRRRRYNGLSDDARSRLRGAKIGFIFQSFNLIPDLDIFDNVDVPLRYRRMKAAERREHHERARLVRLASRAHHLPSQLSGGQQRRVAIARAIAGDPKFLLADSRPATRIR